MLACWISLVDLGSAMKYGESCATGHRLSAQVHLLLWAAMLLFAATLFPKDWNNRQHQQRRHGVVEAPATPLCV